MPYKDYDYFTTDPGAETVVYCRICGSACDVRRNVRVSAATPPYLHDVFICSHANAPWHQQAITLTHAIEALSSKQATSLALEKLLKRQLN